MIAELVEIKCCPRCRNEHPATREYFYPNSATQSGLTSWCKSCIKLQRRLDYRRNMDALRVDPDAYREYRRKVNTREHKLRILYPERYRNYRRRCLLRRASKRIGLKP